EFDRQEIEKALDEPADAVLGVPEPPRAVPDHDLADLVAARGRQHRDEPVQLAVEPDLAEDLGPVAFHGAIVVVQVKPGEPAGPAVEDLARPDLVPGVVADLLPAADHVEAAVQGGEEAGDLLRVVLQVGVEGEDDVAAGGPEAGRERGGLAEVAPEADALH